jgi:hypothetical protein
VRRLGIFFGLVLFACTAGHGDTDPDYGVPPPAGKDMRIKDVTNPTLPQHANYLVSGNTVVISGAHVSMVDTYDETGDGKSKGTIYVQDLNAHDPYSGTSLYAPSFVPGNLHVSMNDVLDLNGQYAEAQNIGTAVFAPKAVLPQMSKPTATFRFEVATPPDPVDIDVNDLASYDVGRKWMNMLVRVQNVTIQKDVSTASLSSGRLGVELIAGASGGKCSDPFPKAPTLTNELFDATTLNIPKGTTLKSLTGIVTYFCNLHISPRSPADVQVM